MFYGVAVFLAFTFFILSLLPVGIGITALIENPKFAAVLIPSLISVLLLVPAAFPVVRIFRFKAKKIKFIPEAFVSDYAKSYKTAKVLAWLGHLFFLFAIYLRLFTYQYAGALALPMALYIASICVMEISISKWHKSTAKTNA